MEGGTVQPGHTVIAAGGGWRVEYEIGYIDVTGFDVDNDKISGKAAPGRMGGSYRLYFRTGLSRVSASQRAGGCQR